MARSWPTPAQAIRGRRRSSKLWAGVVVGLTVTVLAILGSTLSAVQGITRGFYDNQLGADAVANAHRELLHLQTDVVRLRTAEDTAPVEIRRGLLRQQLRVLPGILGPARTRQVQVIDEGIRAIDWSRLEHLPAPGPERDRILDAFDQRLRAIEVEYKEFNDQQIRRFYQAAGEALAAKTDSQRLLGVLVVLTVVLALGWALAARRRSRSDLTEAYEALHLSEERFRSLVQNAGDLTLVCDADGVLTYVSPASARLLGRPDETLMGSRLDELVHADDRPLIDGRWASVVAEGDNPGWVECRLRHRDGAFRQAEVTVTNLFYDPAVGGIVLNIRDVTERRRLESELRHAQKLESVGQLAAGIAHEINTPIQFVGDNVRFLKDAFGDFARLMDAYHQAEGSPEPEAALARARELAAEVDSVFLVAEVPEAIDQTLEGVERVATIVRAMKAFAHPSSEKKALADLNEAVRNTLVVANNELKCAADVVTELGELPLVPCHPGDVNQVLLNLVVNAAHAVAARVGDSGERGTITVRTRHDGDEVVIEVADTGCGIPPEIAERVFEPFFTTKEVGKGTGQGLALAHSLVVDRHGGSIGFHSQPGAGATFAVRLPAPAPDRERPATEILA
jgi:PAS domain S-box-containing protein